MAIATAEDGNLVTIVPRGPLDTELSEALEACVEKALDEGKTRFLLNMLHVPYAGSKGLEVVVQMARRISDADGRLALVGVGDVLAEIFRATRLDRRLAIFDSTESALQTIASGV